MKYSKDTNKIFQEATALLKSNNLPDARKLFQQICRTDKSNAQAWFVLGSINEKLGALNDAASCMRRVIALQPNNAHAHFTLGNIHRNQKKSQKALLSLERAVKIKPDYAAAWEALGKLNKSLGKLNKAETHYRHVVLLRPDWTEAHMKLADILFEMGKNQEALTIYIKLGDALHAKGLLLESIAAYKKALIIDHDNAILYSNIGNMYKSIGELDEAEACLIKAMQLDPSSSIIHNNMGNILKAQGLATQAELIFRQGSELDPSDKIIGSNLLLCLQSISKYSRPEIFEEHIKWAKLHAPSSIACNTHNNEPDPDRRLRIGYVSPDLRTHAVGYVVEPILTNHDPDQFEIICYAEISAPDNFTERLRSMVHKWRNTCGMSDSQVAAAIREDGVDILVDLAGHTSKSRLTVFAYKPAPVQVTYLGYSDTTGMTSIDYRLTDEITDPIGDEKYYTEELFYLRNGFSCYAPPAGVPETSKLPARNTNTVTFGCLNNLYKINSSVISLWCRILHAIPSSHLILFRHILKGEAKNRLYKEFEEHGIDRKRIDLQSELPTEYHRKYTHGTWHMGLFEKIDIMLDTFPRDSHVIACEALWMGVPVVTLYGDRHSGRICASILTAIGLPQLIAQTRDEYFNIATALANNLDELEQIRDTLRGRMSNSSLCDGKKFTGILEEAYRRMWKRWCVRNSR